jgi:hypothetical protein
MVDCKVRIGQTYSNNYYFNGTIDEVAIYNYTKSDAEILADANPTSCTGDVNWCYVNNSCAWGSVKNDTAQELRCSWNVWYNAYNTSNQTWICNVTLTDSNSLSAYGNDTTDVNPVLAVGTPSLLAFGSLAITETSTSDVNTTIRNYGNVKMDLALNGSTLTCTDGSIISSYVHYNCTDYGQSYSTGMSYLPNTLTSANCTRFDLAKNSTATTEAPMASAKNLPWKIMIPHGVNGNCQGTVWFAATSVG